MKMGCGSGPLAAGEREGPELAGCGPMPPQRRVTFDKRTPTSRELFRFLRTARDVDGALSLADGGNSASGCKSSAWRSGSPRDHLIE
jgi:hypothetical protein